MGCRWLSFQGSSFRGDSLPQGVSPSVDLAFHAAAGTTRTRPPTLPVLHTRQVVLRRGQCLASWRVYRVFADQCTGYPKRGKSCEKTSENLKAIMQRDFIWTVCGVPTFLSFRGTIVVSFNAYCQINPMLCIIIVIIVDANKIRRVPANQLQV